MRAYKTHSLYETSDPDAPDAIKDRNGEVVLSLCAVCGAAESELNQSCEARVTRRPARKENER